MNSTFPSLTAKSTILAAIAIALSALAIFDQPSTDATNPGPAAVATVNPDHVSRIELSTATSKVIIERDPITDEWAISAPIEQAADSARVAQLLAVFRTRITADVTVDEGNLKEYGLDAANGIVVELWTDAKQPAASFTIGADMPGGSSFVRVSGDDAIYRARIGGRRRFAYGPSDWRSRVVVDRKETDIQGVRIEPWNGDLVHLIRQPTDQETGDGAWSLDPDPGWNKTPKELAQLVSQLGAMRAANILDDEFDGGFSPPAANITIMDKDGTETTLAIGRRQEGGVAFIRVEGREGVYAVSAADIILFTGGAAAIPDRVMFRVDEADMERLSLFQRKLKVDLARDAETGVWNIVSPEGVTADIADIQFVVRQLSAPKGEEEAGEVSGRRTGLGKPRMVFEVQRKDGSLEALVVGRHFRNAQGAIFFWVKSQAGEQVYVMSEPTLTRLRAGFGQR